VVEMNRKVAQALLGAAMLAALAGCAYQDPLALPDLGPPARSSQQQYPGYSPYYGYGYNYGYGSGYRPGYDPYYSPYYGGGDPRYYTPGVVYVPYPRYPCPAPTRIAMAAATSDRRRTAASPRARTTMTTGPATSTTASNVRHAHATTPRVTVPACDAAKSIDTPHRG
jgi:predicted small lipoprotein YifL